MNDDQNSHKAELKELFSRFVFFKKHIRSDFSVKPDTFIPHPHSALSISRHKSLKDQQIWQTGEKVAQNRKLSLFGRAVGEETIFSCYNLEIVPSPTDIDNNHADVTGWPADKPSQKMIAQEISALVTFFQKP